MCINFTFRILNRHCADSIYIYTVTTLHISILQEGEEELSTKPKCGTEKDRAVRLNARTAAKSLKIHCTTLCTQAHKHTYMYVHDLMSYYTITASVNTHSFLSPRD